jgi:iron complex transport system substrate-binding protein
LKTRFLTISIMLAVIIISTAIISGCQPENIPADTQNTPTESSTPSVETRTITDMFGRTVTIPVKVNTALTCTPMEMAILTLTAPEQLMGLTFGLAGDPPLASKTLREKPVVGGWFAMFTTNYETFISMDPDIVFESQEQFIEERQQKLGSIPVVGIDIWDSANLEDFIPNIKFAAEIMGSQESSNKLIKYFNEATEYANSIAAQVPEAERVKVYYAEGKDGLSTDPMNSSHTELVDHFGGINVAEVPIKPGYGMAEVSIETIMTWDPDIIIIGRGTQEALYEMITTDTQWAEITAVKSNRVYTRPENPLSWFDGPPSVNQIVGIYWTIQKMYPELTKDLDIEAKVKEFYADFYQYELTDKEVNFLLATDGN